ncbi:hypothetical protein K32_07920 [Kaistia sp. 32K]|uniref:M14-type cytosolic carboxypeptidase n=1 Tax=Kaistia sp. 32K TaxID=2795690 RepID=UPI001915909F|nr:M14-type cytosolic carboxypeptidase [Kaistia sp. 32K]BCP52175.1 hypothetical protein K32_07920 [Kaistia sp. 32K]
MTIEAFADLLPVPASGNGRLAAPFDGETLDVEIEADPGIGALQWFHFSVHAASVPRIRIRNAGQSTYPRGWEDAVVWAQPAGEAWRPIRARYADAKLSFPHAAPGGEATYALFPPFGEDRLTRMGQRVGASCFGEVVSEDERSGRATRLVLGDPDPSARQIWVVCGQHGNEHPALWFAEGLVEALLEADRLPAGRRFHVVPVANPGGMRRGHLRANPQGQDPNRHWGGQGDPCPEVVTLRQAMDGTGVDALLDVHTDFEIGYVYLDVLDEWLGTAAPLSRRRERFERGLAGRSGDVAFGRRYPWSEPPHPDLLAGMCAPAVERRFGATAMTLELPIGAYRDASGASGIWSPEHSLALGRAAAATLLEL